jgi:prepilin-type N-terminal cleavage/methylation domain-containing protein
MKSKIKGFTLVEMIVTIVIIVALASISTPIYRSYTEKAALAEGYALLGVIRSAQEQYYSEYGVFLRTLNSTFQAYDAYGCYDDVLNINARTNKYFTKFIISLHNQGASMGINSGFKWDHQFSPVVVGNVNGTVISLALLYNLTTGARYYKVNGSIGY